MDLINNANVIRIHLHTMDANIDHIHRQAIEVTPNHFMFPEVIQEHCTVRPIAPRLFPTKLITTTRSEKNYDLSCLRYLVSGGEANPVATCDNLSKLLTKYCAPNNVIVPGFGMTETCAGSVYTSPCPRYDLDHEYDFVSLGHFIPGMELQITIQTGPEKVAATSRRGDLELRGPVVFSEYYNNLPATKAAFTDDE